MRTYQSEGEVQQNAHSRIVLTLRFHIFIFLYSLQFPVRGVCGYSYRSIRYTCINQHVQFLNY